ncbi:MAG TPA: hypothetical protein VG733_04845 [Chthoniobacteraceae bacterium]|nr:hypothetical protein [Chthoniobacteraceae bacterium]
MSATRYILELCDTAGEHKPIARFESPTPFTAVNVGDRFDDTGWPRLDGAGVIASPTQPIRYTVHSIKHLVETTPEGLVVRYCLNLQPYSGPASPVWG